jgi:hypothetical protein
MTEKVTRLIKARPVGGRMLRVRFAGDRRDYELDMTGLIARSAHFAPLMDDAETFGKVAIVEDGLGVAWPVQTKWGRNTTALLNSGCPQTGGATRISLGKYVR